MKIAGVSSGATSHTNQRSMVQSIVSKRLEHTTIPMYSQAILNACHRVTIHIMTPLSPFGNATVSKLPVRLCVKLYNSSTQPRTPPQFGEPRPPLQHVQSVWLRVTLVCCTSPGERQAQTRTQSSLANWGRRERPELFQSTAVSSGPIRKLRAFLTAMLISTSIYP